MIKKRSILGFVPPIFNRDMKINPVVQTARAMRIARAIKRGRLETGDVRELIKLGKSLFLKENQIGNKYLSNVEVGLNSLMSESENVVVLQENDKMSGTISNLKRTTVNINEPMLKSYAKLPHRHNNTCRDVINTDTDCINPKKRVLLISRCGFNQRTIDFLGQDAFISVGNMKSLTECEKHIDKLRRKSGGQRELANVGSNRTKYKKRKTASEICSLIKRIETDIIINSDMEEYCSRVSIHICRIRDLECCQNPMDTLAAMYLETEKMENKSLRKEQFIKKFTVISNKEWEFKNSILLSVDANIRRSEAFKKDIQIIKTVKRKLEPNMRFNLKVIEHYERGVNLNKLSSIEKDDLPAGTFLIVESIGDSRCVLVDSEESVRYNGYSPVKLRYDYFVKIHYICSESDSDVPVIKTKSEAEMDFENQELADEFYPDRENTFNVDLEKININGGNKEGRYNLGLNNAVVDELSKINQYLSKTNQDTMEEEELLFKQIKNNATDFKDIDPDIISDNVKPTSVFDMEDDDSDINEDYIDFDLDFDEDAV